MKIIDFLVHSLIFICMISGVIGLYFHIIKNETWEIILTGICIGSMAILVFGCSLVIFIPPIFDDTKKIKEEKK